MENFIIGGQKPPGENIPNLKGWSEGNMDN